MNCSYEEIQTDKTVWTALLEKCPISSEEIFYEPFKGTGNLYDQVDCKKKYWAEITEGHDVFDFEQTNKDITVIYSNPPFKCLIPNKKGIKTLKNCCYFFLEYFMLNFVSLKRIGFILNTACFQSLTPKRYKRMEDLGFTVTKLVVFNVQKWYGRYYFIVFERASTNKFVEYLPNYF
jgi:hypothetical protein